MRIPFITSTKKTHHGNSRVILGFEKDCGMVGEQFLRRKFWKSANTRIPLAQKHFTLDKVLFFTDPHFLFFKRYRTLQHICKPTQADTQTKGLQKSETSPAQMSKFDRIIINLL